MAQNNLIILAAGGTGGHVFPAVATAAELEKLGHETEYWTDKRGLKYLSGKTNIKLIQSASPSGITQIFKLVIGFLQSLFYLIKNRPFAVVGFGGYPSFPPLLAARLLFIRTILHEANSIPGKANRILSKFANVTATSFLAANGVYVGNPVRSDITPSPYPAIQGKVNLLVTGGSQGAKLFAQVVPKSLNKFRDEIVVTHQVPENLLAQVKAEYQGVGISAEVKSFFSNMPELLKNAHLLIARSGASTVSELEIAGRPAIFVPLAIAADDHQTENAKNIVSAGGGWLIEEKDFTPENLENLLTEIIPTKLAYAAANIAKLAKPDAAKQLALLITNKI